MSMATMTMAPAATGANHEFDDRNQAIDVLVNQLGWSPKRVGPIVGRSDRHVRRIAREARESGASVPDSTPALTPKEIETMARDYASDPYSSPEDREAALGWVAVVAQASGVEELGRIKFGRGIRVAKPRVGQA